MLTNNCDGPRPEEQVQLPPPFQPTEADAREASRLFGELENDLDLVEFEARLNGLDPVRHRAATKAIDTLRVILIEYHAHNVLKRAKVLGWIDASGASNRVAGDEEAR